MKHLIPLMIVVSAGAAFAQTGGGTGSTIAGQVYFYTAGNSTTAGGTDTFGPSACNDTLTVYWQNAALISFYSQCSMNGMQVWITEGSTCGTEPGATDLELSEIAGLSLSTAKTGSFSFKRSSMPGFVTSTDGGVSCGATGVSITHKVCGAIAYSTYSGISCNTATTFKATPLTIVYDTQPPVAPTLDEVIPQDSALKAKFTANDSDTDRIVAQVRAAGSTDAFEDKGSATVSSGTTFVLAKDLENYKSYDVQLIAFDAAGNQSAPSASQVGTPVAVCGFLCQYYRAGGTDDYRGCSTGLAAVPTLVVLWALRRRKTSQRSKS